MRLQDALAARDIRSVIVGRHSLTLRGAAPAPPPTPGDPELHIFGADRYRIITTDGQRYSSADGVHPADDPGGAARCFLLADTHDRASGQVPRPGDHGSGERNGVVIGAGERALRRLRDDGVI
jgi:hypothetical protein